MKSSMNTQTNYIFRLNFYFWELLRRWAETSWKSLSSAAPYFLSFWVVSNSEAPLVIPSCNTDPVLPHGTLFLLIFDSLWALISFISIFSLLTSNFWSFSRREAGYWWDLICSRLFSVSVLSFALARFHNMVANDEHFCRAEFTLLFIFRFVFDSRECFSFLNVSS